jgi:AcrR family transcriptional regulator
MARPRNVDRDALLDAAEALLAAQGLPALTFGALATASGLAKPTVQSVFGSRDALLAAVLQRWLAREQLRFDAELAKVTRGGTTADAASRTRAHILSTSAETPATGRQMVHLLAALAVAGPKVQPGQPGQQGALPWYAARLGSLAAATDDQRRWRLALLAAEGAFYVRHLAQLPMDDERWADIFRDILALAEGTGPAVVRAASRRQGGT